MAQTNINIRIDEDLKKEMEITCRELGLNITTAFNIFAKKMCRERRIPFEVSYDPFYSESNMNHLRRGIEALNAGKGIEHDIIEVDWWEKYGLMKHGKIIFIGNNKTKER